MILTDDFTNCQMTDDFTNCQMTDDFTNCQMGSADTQWVNPLSATALPLTSKIIWH